LQYCRCSIIVFSFPSFLEFHKVDPLLQTCFTYEFVYDHAYFCEYVYFWIYLVWIRENTWHLSFWAWFTSLNMMSSNCIHLLPTTCYYSFWLSKTLLCIYTTFSWFICQL
jgi:hypothetical protein